MSRPSNPEPDSPQEEVEEPAAALPQDRPEGTESDEDLARRRFREALDRKKFGHHGKGQSADPRARAPHASPAKPQRTFRRKSG